MSTRQKLMIFFLILLFAVPVFAQDNVWFTGSFEEAKDKAVREDKMLMIDFFSYN